MAKKKKRKDKKQARKRPKRLPTDLATMLGQCESPIERQLLYALWRALHGVAVLHTQVPIGMYRADFLAQRADLRVVIEADGREFHTSPEQREYDQRRDEYMIKKGYRVLRYTGSQIAADARTCAAGVVAVFESTPIPDPATRITRAEVRRRTRANTIARRNRKLAASNEYRLRRDSQPLPPSPPPTPRHIGTIVHF